MGTRSARLSRKRSKPTRPLVAMLVDVRHAYPARVSSLRGLMCTQYRQKHGRRTPTPSYDVNCFSSWVFPPHKADELDAIEACLGMVASTTMLMRPAK
jgi:hypothetical protein